jgi:putative ATP-dependent endonuclease of OLD family
MIVSKLEIQGFRGIRKGDISLLQFTSLIGANNCGKTTITEALALVLGRDRLVRPLTEHDFHGSTPSPTDRIVIVATLVGFEPNDPRNQTDWFRWGRGTIKWQDVDTGAVRSVADKPTDKLACQIAFAARFDLDSLETITARYFYDADIDPFQEDAAIATVPTELIRQVGFFLVPANRTWDRTISLDQSYFVASSPT